MKNIAIIGAGPIGITTACLLKARNPTYNITVLDKRKEAKRSHGLSVSADSIKEISKLLNDNHELQAIFKGWKGGFVRTNQIEKALADQAEKMGVTVLRDATHEYKKGDITTNKVLQAADCIIAADGAKSSVREALNIPRVDEESMQYMVELKFQTSGSTRPRGYKEATKEASKTGHIGVELVNRHPTAEDKSATFLMFVDKETYDAMRVNNKGVYGNAWNFTELKELGSRDERVQKVYNAMMRYKAKVETRDGNISQEQIATVELAIYRNDQSYVKSEGKDVLFVGDANSGLILQRGFNKGLKEAALLVQAVEKGTEDAYKGYEKATVNMFREERSAILLKNKGINLSQRFVGFISRISDAIKKVISVVRQVFTSIATFFVPRKLRPG
ncbi:MAG: hypothetical protein JSR37_01350 [Verrucomicrobia bacterium]|nr:hypothetical protein [Verrucomicrobiota bacterium]MBS0636669.1 hypothetical protein [Verrucomicrobiota bacterium]